MPDTSVKVIAYITSGDRLLVFSHPHHPEAGIQVPAGTVEDDEPLKDAVLREAEEETGLEEQELRAYLGEQLLDLLVFGLSGAQRRHSFHLVLTARAPEIWRHYEMTPSDRSPGTIKLECFWAKLPDGAPELAGRQGDLLNELLTARGVTPVAKDSAMIEPFEDTARTAEDGHNGR